jgi:hypothetical protein
MRLFDESLGARLYGRAPARSSKIATALLACAALALTFLPRHGYACSFVESRALAGHVLGASWRELPPVPRNAAYLWSLPEGADPAAALVLATDAATHDPVMGHVVRRIATGSGYFPKSAGLYIAKPDELLAPHRMFIGFGNRSVPAYTTADYVDEQPPAAPVLTSGAITHHDGETACSSDSCGEYDYLNFSIATSVQDDHKPTEMVTYAVYLERSAEQARTASTAFALLTGHTGTFVDAAWVDSDAFIAVSAIDFAGNESPRSEPLQVSGSGGCAIQTRRHHRPVVGITLIALAILAWVRRRTGRR